VGATIPSMPRGAKHRRWGRLAVATSEETEPDPGCARVVKKMLSGRRRNWGVLISSTPLRPPHGVAKVCLVHQ
jgi:hypothetical protein